MIKKKKQVEKPCFDLIESLSPRNFLWNFLGGIFSGLISRSFVAVSRTIGQKCDPQRYHYPI